MQYRDGFNKRANGDFSRVELFINKPDNKGQPYTAEAFFYTKELTIDYNDINKYAFAGERILQKLASVDVLERRLISGDSVCIYLIVKFFQEIDMKEAEYYNIQMHWGR